MAGMGAVGWIIYAVVIIAMFYFLGVVSAAGKEKTAGFDELPCCGRYGSYQFGVLRCHH